MALTMIFIGISSFFYHGTMSYIGQFFDVFSMYVFAILLSLGSLIRRGEMSAKKAIAIFLIVGVITGYIQYVIPFIRRILFGILLAPGIILAQQPRTTGHKWFSNATRYFYVAAACLTTAYVFWYFDKSAALCMPNSLFQGHAVWHILTALGAYMVILHYKNTSHKITNK
jgi:hypothetical protein